MFDMVYYMKSQKEVFSDRTDAIECYAANGKTIFQIQGKIVDVLDVPDPGERGTRWSASAMQVRERLIQHLIRLARAVHKEKAREAKQVAKCETCTKSEAVCRRIRHKC